MRTRFYLFRSFNCVIIPDFILGIYYLELNYKFSFFFFLLKQVLFMMHLIYDRACLFLYFKNI
jgi:hypothetical protein